MFKGTTDHVLTYFKCQAGKEAYAVNVGRAAYFDYRPPGDLSWRGSAVFV
jgi:hypothetical protein